MERQANIGIVRWQDTILGEKNSRSTTGVKHANVLFSPIVRRIMKCNDCLDNRYKVRFLKIWLPQEADLVRLPPKRLPLKEYRDMYIQAGAELSHQQDSDL
ncbi:hypothetical protein INT43_003149 [Umbelopsis isabellina]|uniref:Uncharacterized protein n=1 Tax=Mortierella isabellina TaxID=91625 RepID=A0A8H7PPN0_MORIS|nr:hypothetical protein INT43_003149 [Umbelopsis isabellina]